MKVYIARDGVGYSESRGDIHLFTKEPIFSDRRDKFYIADEEADLIALPIDSFPEVLNAQCVEAEIVIRKEEK